MHIYTIDPLHDPHWVSFIHKAPQASIFHTREWLDSLHRTYGYHPVAFTTSRPTGELRNGLLFCHIRSLFTGNRMVSVPFSDHCEPLVDSDEELDFLVNCLCADREQFGWNSIEIRPVNGRFHKEGQNTGFSPGKSYYLHRLDLRPSLGEIFQSLDKDSVRRRIQHAERAGITYKCGRSEILLREFYDLLVLTRRRHHLPPQPYAWFCNLVACMGDAIEIRVAYNGTVPIATVLTLRFRNTIYYKYGGSDARYHNLAAMPALLWRTIQESKDAGCEELDLGRSDCEDKGLKAFKDHWTQSCSRLVYWRYPAPSSLSAMHSWRLTLVKHAVACLPKGLLVIAGRLMYRHIG